MAYQVDENTGDIVINGWENGIAQSPHLGIGNLQSVNVSTETGEVMCNYSRIAETALDMVTHTVTQINGSTLQETDSFRPFAGIWITIGTSTIANLTAGDNYYIISSENGQIDISLANTYNGTPISTFGSGTATYTILRVMGKAVQGATEYYSDGTNMLNRYYILDVNGLVWCYDTATASAANGLGWFLPDFSISYYGSAVPSGMAVLNGWIHVFAGNQIWCKPTVNLGNTTTNSTTFVSFSSGVMVSPNASPNPHFAFVGHQGSLYYTDGNFIGKIFPNTTLLSNLGANIQSYASYTAPTSADNTKGTINPLIGGSLPTLGGNSSSRVPALFFPSAGGTVANALSTSNVFWIAYSTGLGYFQVYSASTGGSALDISTGSSGIQYFNTYSPTTTGGESLLVFTPEKLNLPFFETAKCMAELNNIIIIGCTSNSIYPWDQTSVTPANVILLAESNSQQMLTANNNVYIFAGSKGNIYITSGSAVSGVISVPDYCAGIAGTAGSYIEPYFIWGGVMFIRGRIFFSVQDQTSTKTGNCGGIWSFIPTSALFIGQDVGMSLRLENQSSYATYNGLSTVLIPLVNQNVNGVQYWSAWTSSVTSPKYGIDGSNTTVFTGGAIIETDFIPTGTLLDKESVGQIEFKLSTALATGESISIKYRVDLTTAFSSFTSSQVLDSTGLSGYYTPDFQATQWIQLQAILLSSTNSTSSFVRLKELRIKKV